MGLKQSIFDVQKAVIPLKKALTKLFKSYLIAKFCLLVKMLLNLPKYFMLTPFLAPLLNFKFHAYLLLHINNF